MATIKPHLNKKYKSKDGYPVCIRIIDGATRYIYPVCEDKIEEKDWNGSEVKSKHPRAFYINACLADELNKAKNYYAECRLKDLKPDPRLAFTAQKSHSFTGYIQKRAEQYKSVDKAIMYLKAKRMAKELEEYKGREVYFNEVDADFLRGFDAWLTALPNEANTRAKKFDFLSRWFNNALEEEKATGVNPFKRYKITTTPTKKGKLSLEEIKALEGLQLKEGAVQLSRDMFLFSYLCKGIRFETVATLKKEQVKNGRVFFTANKTAKQGSAIIHQRMQAIIDRYMEKEGVFLFPLISELPTDPFERKKVLDVANVIANRNLKTAAGLAEIKQKVSFHMARHSFAFHLKKVSKNSNVIKDALQHSNAAITERYLRELDDEFLDQELQGLYGE